MDTLTIIPVSEPGDYRTGTLSGLNPGQISAKLGFSPNVEDDASKVSHSWGFTVDGVRCGVWSYKGSERAGVWSTFGPIEALRAVFGAAVREG